MKKIVITAEDNLENLEIEVTGEWNGSHVRRALAAAGKHIRHEATRKHYAYVEQELANEKKEKAVIVEETSEEDKANELANEEYRETEAATATDVDEDLPEQGDEKEEDSKPEKDDNDLSYLSDPDNGDKNEDK